MYSQGGLAAGRDASPYVYSLQHVSRDPSQQIEAAPRHLKIFQNLKGWK